MIRYLLAILLLAASAAAQTAETQYIDTGTGCGGNDGSAGNPYCSCAEWEAQNRNLVSENVNLTVLATGTDTSSCKIEGWTLDGTRRITIDGQGTYNLASTAYDAPMEIRAQNEITLQDMTVTRNGTGSKCATGIFIFGWNSAFSGTGSLDGVVIQRVEVIDGGTLSGDDCSQSGLIQISKATSGDEIIIRNTIVRNAQTGTTLSGISIGCEGGEIIRLHNVTVNSSDDNGIEDQTNNSACATIETINALSCNSGTADYSQGASPTTRTNTTNASCDTSSPNNALDSVTPAFTSSTDLHLTASSTDLIDAGTTIAAFSDDIDEDSRPSGSAWDVGADEYIAAATAVIKATLTGGLSNMKGGFQ